MINFIDTKKLQNNKTLCETYILLDTIFKIINKQNIEYLH